MNGTTKPISFSTSRDISKQRQNFGLKFKEIYNSITDMCWIFELATGVGRKF